MRRFVCCTEDADGGKDAGSRSRKRTPACCGGVLLLVSSRGRTRGECPVVVGGVETRERESSRSDVLWSTWAEL